MQVTEMQTSYNKLVNTKYSVVKAWENRVTQHVNILAISVLVLRKPRKILPGGLVKFYHHFTTHSCLLSGSYSVALRGFPTFLHGKNALNMLIIW
jgi:hypothetical protein